MQQKFKNGMMAGTTIMHRGTAHVSKDNAKCGKKEKLTLTQKGAHPEIYCKNPKNTLLGHLYKHAKNT